MLMHVGCGTMICGSMTCRNYDGTCDGGRILGRKKKRTKKKEEKEKKGERKGERSLD